MKDYAEKSITLETGGTYPKKCTVYANEDSTVTVTFNNFDSVNFPNVTKTISLVQGGSLYNVNDITCVSGCVTCAE